MSNRMVFVLSLVLMSGCSRAQSLQIDNTEVTRNDVLKATLRLPSPARGPGRLTLTWSDSYGRIVAIDSRQVQVAGDAIPILLSLKPAVALQNFLEAKLEFNNTTIKTAPTEFIVTPSSRLDDYQVIMYYHYKPEQQAGLRDLGVTAGQSQNVASQTPDGSAIWWKYNFRYYCDQMATEFYSTYHTPSLNPKNKLMIEAKAAYKADRTTKEAFFRQACFHDPGAEAEAMARIRQVVSAQRRFKPFYYSTDETGVADLVEAWDFCFCPRTLKVMRQWLLKQYGSLEGINQEWGTHFATLDEVVPSSSDEMMKRDDGNLSSWADHRTFMNLTFAEAVKKASEMVKSVDPSAIAGLLGCQMPSAFGGYDYWLLSQSMDMAEPYNIGNNREIWRSFAPKKPALTTGFGADQMEVWRLWYQALHGDLGVIIYDEENRYLDSSGKPTALGAEVAPTYKELTGGLGKQLAQMERINDRIAIHYSHPSVTAHWMLERRPLGEAWVDKQSRDERLDSDFLRLRQSAVHLLEDNLQQYYFVSYAQLEDGAFDRMGAQVMLLPQSVAMSPAECAALRRFVERGGVLIADCRTAWMDSHGKLLKKAQLDDLFGIEHLRLEYAPGPAGLTPIGKQAGTPPTGMLEKVAAAEPGIKLLAGATALYQDTRGTPAVIMKQQGKGKTIYLNAVITDYHRWRLRPPEGDGLRQLVATLLKSAGVPHQYDITQSNGQSVTGLEIHPWQSGQLRILGIQRNYGLRVSELGPPEYQSQEALERPLDLQVRFGRQVALYDTRQGKYLGTRDRYTFSPEKIQPTVLAILPAPVKGLAVTAPRQAKAGELLSIHLKLNGPALGDAHVLRTQLLDPSGNDLTMLAANLAAPHGQAVWELPLAVNLAKGRYTLRVRDVATGTQAEHLLDVN